MRIIKKLAILLLLGVCYFMSDRNTPVFAQTSCPERDQCLDDAYAAYQDFIALAQQTYSNCEQVASTDRNLCLDNAEQAKSTCEDEADSIYENNLGRCMVISDPYESEYCIQELENIRQQTYSICSSVYDNGVQICWWDYGSDVQVCEMGFYDDANQAQEMWDLYRSSCPNCDQ